MPRIPAVLAGLVVAAAALPAAPTNAAAASHLTHVIVRGANAGCTQTVAHAVAALGGRMTYVIQLMDGGAALLPQSEVNALRSLPCVASVTPDSTITLTSAGAYDPTQDAASLYSTTQEIGAQQLWKKGFTGQGVGVAVIDTGIAPVQGLLGSGQVINGPDLSFDSQAQALTYNDEYGHGTHMAGIIGGNDLYGSGNGAAYAGDSQHFIGVAPDAHLLNMKVGDENGVVDVSQVLASIDWVVQHRNDNAMNIRVLNLSFGTQSTQGYLLDPLAFAAEAAWHNGIVVVVSAGNSGTTFGQLNDPAYDPYVLAVGAADTRGTTSQSDDTVAPFSSRGDGARNPDLVAPGVHIASLRVPGSQADLAFGSTATVGTRFFRGSGSSQATAVAAGAAALLLSEFPNATPDQIKYAMTASARQLSNQPASAQGHGELNVNAFSRGTPGASGVTLTVTTDGGTMTLSAGSQTQAFAPATGLGSLEAARGGMHVVANGVALTGEQDIFGTAFNAAAMAGAETSGAAWSAGSWNGAGWSGAGWSGAGWSGAGWSGAGWSGAGWSGAGWSGSTWSGAGWSGAGWSGAGWSGAGWSGAGWSGAGWSGAGWSGAAWSGAGWSDMSWA